MKTKEKLFLVDFLIDQLNKNNQLGKKKIEKTTNVMNSFSSLVPFILYNNIHIIQKLYNEKNEYKNINELISELHSVTYRKVYQSLYLKQIPLQLTQLYITTTPQFKDNLTFSGFRASSTSTLISTSEKANKTTQKENIIKNKTTIGTDNLLKQDTNLFYNLFIKSYATSNALNKTKDTKQFASPDHIAYNLNTLDSIKNSNPNFSNVLLPISLFLKKKRQILLINKNISNKKIKKLYYNWYRIQVTRRYLHSVNQNIKSKKKSFSKFYLFAQKEQQKINKFKTLKKIL